MNFQRPSQQAGLEDDSSDEAQESKDGLRNQISPDETETAPMPVQPVYPHELRSRQVLDDKTLTIPKVVRALEKIENAKGTCTALITAQQFCLWANHRRQESNLELADVQRFIDAHLVPSP